tara:strand:- start:537 stop:881 length:345 start_codon:yes stop_codon:yes gene_type:complete
LIIVTRSEAFKNLIGFLEVELPADGQETTSINLEQRILPSLCQIAFILERWLKTAIANGVLEIVTRILHSLTQEGTVAMADGGHNHNHGHGHAHVCSANQFVSNRFPRDLKISS